jgi:putative ATP-binding cassette transporter
MPQLGRVISFLFSFSRQVPRARATFSVIILLGLLGGLSNTALIAVINSRLHGGTARSLLWAFIGLCVAMPLARLISSLLLIRLSQKSILEVRLQLGRKILQAPLADLEKTGPHRLLNVLTDDVSTIAGALTSLPLFVMQLSVVIGCLVYLGWLSWVGLLVVLGFMIVGVLTYQLPMARAGRHFSNARQFGDFLFKSLRALTEGIKELKLHRNRREDFLLRGLEKSSRDLQRENYLGNAAAIGAASWGQILFFVLVGVTLFLLPELIPVDSRVLTGYALTILYMMTPLEAVMNTIPVFGRAAVGVDQVERLGLSLLENAREAQATTDPEPGWRELRLAGATHAYHRENQEESFLLGPIDLTLRPGEILFLVGGNGSGKTTLAKLLTGLYIPENGEIRLDGEPITDATRDRYRQLFTVVFSDFFLFETLFGLSAAELDSEAHRYLERLQLDKKVEVKDGVLSTIQLSQGQRKRLALLTAYLEDRPIYLFDEWAADQDPYFKQVFYHHLLPDLKARGKTVVVISHDDHYYNVADRLVKLDYGQIEYDRYLAEAELEKAVH